MHAMVKFYVMDAVFQRSFAVIQKLMLTALLITLCRAVRVFYTQVKHKTLFLYLTFIALLFVFNILVPELFIILVF